MGDGWEPGGVSVGRITEGPEGGDVIGGVTEGPWGGVAVGGVIDGPGGCVDSCCLGKGDAGVGVTTEGPEGGESCCMLNEDSDEAGGKDGVGGSVEP